MMEHPGAKLSLCGEGLWDSELDTAERRAERRRDKPPCKCSFEPLSCLQLHPRANKFPLLFLSKFEPDFCLLQQGVLP